MGSVKDLVVEVSPRRLLCGVGSLRYSNRYSVFDWGEMPDHLTNKGAALCTTSAYFFEQLKKRDVPTHYRGVGRDGNYGSLGEMDDAPTEMRIALARVIRPVPLGASYDYTPIREAAGNFVIPIEVIYRNSLPKGSSVFRRLKEGTLTLEEMGLSSQPAEGQRLPVPFIDGSTKYEEFDRYPGWVELQQLAGLSAMEMEQLKEYAMAANEVISDGMSRAGFVNDDGKIEVAFTGMRTMMIVDTLGTLDECRITYKGVDVSKQIPRDWYSYSQPDWKEELDRAKKENRIGWKERVKSRPRPLPPALKQIMEAFYASVANQVIGRTLIADAVPIDEVLAEYQKFRETEMR